MPEVVHGARVGRGAAMRLTVSAVIVDEAGAVLLARRRETDLWGVPGGKVEPGESVAEGLAREVLEEAGIVVEIVRLTAIYSDPHRVIMYSDGRKTQIVNLCFLCHPVTALANAAPVADPDTAEVRYFALDTLPTLLDQHDKRIADALTGEGTVIA